MGEAIKVWLLAYERRIYVFITWRGERLMAKDAVFTMKLEPQLRDAFIAEAQAVDRPASQIVRDLMRDYVQRQRDQRDHDAFVRAKVEAGRRDRVAGLDQSNDEVEAEFATRRLALEGKAGEVRG